MKRVHDRVKLTVYDLPKHKSVGKQKYRSKNSQHNERNGEIGRGEYRGIQCVKTAKYERQGEGRSLKNGNHSQTMFHRK